MKRDHTPHVVATVFVACAAAVPLAALAQTAPTGSGQAYPSKAIRMVVPFAPGGISDILARIAADQINTATGQPVVIDNRAGASGNIGTEMVARATGDGYTLLFAEAAIKGFDVTSWFGVVAPAAIPKERVAVLHAAIARGLAQREVAERLLAQGAEPVNSTPQAFGAYIKVEVEKWARVIKAANIRAN